VGPYRAERLLVAGELVESEHTLAIGLVDELTVAEHFGKRAQVCLQELLAHPVESMMATRRIARADLVAALDGFKDDDLDGFLDEWNSPSTQGALKALVARLGK